MGAMYVLKKDMQCPQDKPYQLSKEEGDYPKSTAHPMVTIRGEKKRMSIDKYFSVPQPRTLQKEMLKSMLAEQHGLDIDSIEEIDFHPEETKFVDNFTLNASCP